MSVFTTCELFNQIAICHIGSNQALQVDHAYQKLRKSYVKVQYPLYYTVDYKGIQVDSCFALWMRSKPKFKVAVRLLPIFASLCV